MRITKRCQKLLALFSLIITTLSAHADNPFGETLQIYTHFRAVLGKPEWVLILRDVESGQVLPYLFDIRNDENYWVAFSFGHSYRVVSSSLKFGVYANIKNFCHLEDGVLTGQSMQINLSGVLTPDPNSIKCNVIKFRGLPFTIVNQNE